MLLGKYVVTQTSIASSPAMPAMPATRPPLPKRAFPKPEQAKATKCRGRIATAGASAASGVAGNWALAVAKLEDVLRARVSTHVEHHEHHLRDFCFIQLRISRRANMPSVKFSRDSIERNIDIHFALYSCFE